MKKKIINFVKPFHYIFLIFILFNITFATDFIKIGYGTLGYRLGLETSLGTWPSKYISITTEATDSSVEGYFLYTTIDNVTYTWKYTYVPIYITLSLSIPTQVWGVYISPFVKARYIYFKLENTTEVLYKTGNWKIGGGIALSTYLQIIKGLMIVPRAALYYIPEKTFSYNNLDITTVGCNCIQKEFSVDVNLAF